MKSSTSFYNESIHRRKLCNSYWKLSFHGFVCFENCPAPPCPEARAVSLHLRDYGQAAMPNEGSTRVGEVCHQMYGVSCIIEKDSPGQEECRGAPHPPTCAKPSPHPHRLTDTVAGLVGGAGQLVDSHRLQAEQLKLPALVTAWKATASAQLRRTGRPRYRHPLSLALSWNTHRSSSFPASLLPRCTWPGPAETAGAVGCWCDLPGRSRTGRWRAGKGRRRRRREPSTVEKEPAWSQ